MHYLSPEVNVSAWQSKLQNNWWHTIQDMFSRIYFPLNLRNQHRPYSMITVCYIHANYFCYGLHHPSTGLVAGCKFAGDCKWATALSQARRNFWECVPYHVAWYDWNRERSLVELWLLTSMERRLTSLWPRYLYHSSLRKFVLLSVNILFGILCSLICISFHGTNADLRIRFLHRK